MWCKFGRSSSFRLEHWYTMIYHRNGDVQIKTPLQWWWIYEIPPDLIPGENDRSSQRLSQRLWFGGLGNYFSFWDGLFFWGGYPVWVFPAQFGSKRMNFQVLRKTSGRSLGANLSCTFDREFPTKRRGTPRVKKRVKMVAGPRDSCSCSCGWYPPDIELAPADAWWKEAIRHETENRWCLGIGCEGNRSRPEKKWRESLVMTIKHTTKVPSRW